MNVHRALSAFGALFVLASPWVASAQAPTPLPAHDVVIAAPCARECDFAGGPLVVPPIEVGGFRIRIGGYAQGQYQSDGSSDTQLAADGTHLLNRDAFALRRGRLVFQVERSVASLLVELDASSSPDSGMGVRAIRAEATLQWPPSPHTAPYAALTLGLFRTPFGDEVVRSPRDRLFMENSTITRALFPGETDVGVRLQGSLGWFRYAIAAVNGHPIDEPRFGGRAPTPSGDVVGRLGADIAVGDAHFVSGVSLLGGTGFHPGAPATKDVLVVRNSSESGMIGPNDLTLISGHAATPSVTYGRWALGADLMLAGTVGAAVAYWLRGEVIVASNLDRALYPADPIATGYDVRELGLTASLVQLFWRFLLVGVRFDYYDPFLDAQSRIGGTPARVAETVMTGAFAIGVQWPRTQTRLVAEYDHVLDHLALGADGGPTDLRNDRFTLRLQVAF